MTKLVSQMEGTVYDELIGGHTIHPSVKNVEVVAGGGTLKRGTLLGMVTKDGDADKGKYKMVDAKQTDGTQIADCVLARDIAVQDTAIVAEVYRSGEFNRQNLIVAENDSPTAHEEELRNKNIIMTAMY